MGNSKRESRCQILITEMPVAIREALSEDAQARDVSRNEAAVAVLAARYSVERQPSSTPFRPVAVDTDGPITFDVPTKLREKLRVAAARQGATIAGLIRAALAEHYGLPVEPPTRRPRTATRGDA